MSSSITPEATEARARGCVPTEIATSASERVLNGERRALSDQRVELHPHPSTCTPAILSTQWRDQALCCGTQRTRKVNETRFTSQLHSCTRILKPLLWPAHIPFAWGSAALKCCGLKARCASAEREAEELLLGRARSQSHSRARPRLSLAPPSRTVTSHIKGGILLFKPSGIASLYSPSDRAKRLRAGRSQAQEARRERARRNQQSTRRFATRTISLALVLMRAFIVRLQDASTRRAILHRALSIQGESERLPLSGSVSARAASWFLRAEAMQTNSLTSERVSLTYECVRGKLRGDFNSNVKCIRALTARASKRSLHVQRHSFTEHR